MRIVAFPILVAWALSGCGGAQPGARATPSFQEFAGAEALQPVADGRARAAKAPSLVDTAWLFVQVTPADAEIRVDGALQGRGWAYVVEPRTRLRHLSVTSPGFVPIEGFVELEEKRGTKVKLVLRPAGVLTVVTEPPGAGVTCDGFDAGRTPVTLRDIEPGPHRVGLSMGTWKWADDVLVGPAGTQVVSQRIDEYLAKPGQAANIPGPPPARPGSGSQAKRPDCTAVCYRYVQAVNGAETIRDVVRDQCRARCASGDIRFSVCAWNVKTADDVSACAAISEPPPPQGQ